MQATYTFPVGVTTLWWYAEPLSSVSSAKQNINITSNGRYATDDGTGQQFIAEVHSQSTAGTMTPPEYLKFVKGPFNGTMSTD